MTPAYRPLLAACLLGIAFSLTACGGGGVAGGADTAETIVGERLFRETRFAQFFAAHSQGQDVNAPLSQGASDPVMEFSQTSEGAPLPGPYAGLAMNCAACHLVDELGEDPAGGIRTYADFAARSPVPWREDGKARTPRNSPTLVNSALSRDVETFFHFDGEFETLEDLVAGTLAGRNFGWLPGERAQAIAHVARIVREDDGTGANAEDHEGGTLRDIFAARGNIVARAVILKPEFRLEVETASDQAIFDAVCRVIAQYVRELLFTQNPVSGEFTGSPYDVFLQKNGLPTQPDVGESSLDYARRLRAAVDALAAPRFVGDEDGAFGLHAQAFRFGDEELRGLRVFLAEPDVLPLSPEAVAVGGLGSCVTCHAPPSFTDFRFHNIGAAQEEYDDVHGDGAFFGLSVPSLATRSANRDLYLPPTEAHPQGKGPFLAIPSPVAPERTDLGLWNVFGNDDVPGPQAALRSALLDQLGLPPLTTADDLLPRTIAWFKTPGLRDLGQSAPYFHTGRKASLDAVIRHYLDFSVLARADAVRNAAPELAGMALVEDDVEALAAFLRSLNEDYE